MSKADRRVEKTRQAAFDAMVYLLQNRKYAQITVQEIIDHANMGRTTFYAHFPTKDDLLLSYLDTLFESMHRQQIEPTYDTAATLRFMAVSELFVHIGSNVKTIKGLLNSGLEDMLLERFTRYWGATVMQLLSNQSDKRNNEKVPIPVLTHHVINTLISLAKWWVNTDMSDTPAQIEAYYWALILPCIV